MCPGNNDHMKEGAVNRDTGELSTGQDFYWPLFLREFDALGLIDSPMDGEVVFQTCAKSELPAKLPGHYGQ